MGRVCGLWPCGEGGDRYGSSARGRRRDALRAVLAALALVVPGSAAAQARPTEAAVDSLVAAEFAARPIAGMVVAVVQGGDTIYLRARGFADLEHEVPLGTDGVFQIASLTKQFTAAAVLRLVDDGRLSLADDVRRYLPELESHGAAVRVRELLNHTAGLRNIYEMSSWPQIRPLRSPRPEIRALELAGVAEDSLDFEPGTDFHYSNTGYDVLGDLVEAVTGEPIESYLRRTLFQPLGLEHTSLCPWTRVIPHRVRGYEPDSAGTHLDNAWRQSQAVLFTSGGICSTALDLLRWNRALHGDRVLEEASYQAMTTPSGAASSYGFGLFVDRVEDHRRFRHNGYTPGYSAQLEHYPDDDLTVLVLANSPAAVGTLAEGVARVVLGLPARVDPVRPSGWMVRPIRAGADTTVIHFRPMSGGLHVTAGPAAVYFHPDSTAESAYGLSARFAGVDEPDSEGLGLVFGGGGSNDPVDTYLAFVIRTAGEYAVLRHSAGTDEMVVPWTSSAAVAATSANELELTVSGPSVVFRINGTTVQTVPSSRLGTTAGVFGLRVGTGGDVHVSGFGRASGR